MKHLLEFPQRINARRRPPLDHEIVIDSFAGAGGWGCGEEASTGWAVDVAINHDALAIETHKANHPATKHYISDVFEIDPRSVEPGRKIAHGHFSPDCTHHSKARGSAPVSDRVRGLAWIVIVWGYLRRPRVLTLENVEEFRDWGPTRDGKAIPERKGETFKAFIAVLTTGLSPDHPAFGEVMAAVGRWVPREAIIKGLGYKVEHRELRACDYGAPTIRKRFFMVARCDRQPIVWPEPTHAKADDPRVEAGELQPYVAAAECIDWSIPCPSIFLTKAEAKAWGKAHGCNPPKRPLVANTMSRVAHAMKRFVLDHPRPFIIGPGGQRFEPFGCNQPMNTVLTKPNQAVVTPYLVPRYGERAGQAPRGRSADQPMPTVVPSGNGAQLVAPMLIGAGGPVYSGKPRSANEPFNTILKESRAALVAAFVTRHFGGMNGRDIREPMPTATCRATQNQLTAASLVKLRGTCKDGQAMDQCMPTLTTGGNHVGMVSAFLTTYYGNTRDGNDAREPLPTIVKKDRMALVTVQIAGEPYIVVDIGMRMLQPHELLRAQFGEFAEGWVLVGNKTQQTAGIGNSVCPHVAKAICDANVKVRRVAREAVAV